MTSGYPKQRKRSLIVSLSLLLFPSVIANPDCAPECKEASEKTEQLEKSIKRLNDIRAVNLEFISQLDPDQESKRLKANSNVRIAEKRIAEAQAMKASAEQMKATPQCKNCG